MTVQIEATEPLGMNRRDFLTSTAAVGGALVLGFHLPATSARADVIPREPWYGVPDRAELANTLV